MIKVIHCKLFYFPFLPGPDAFTHLLSRFPCLSKEQESHSFSKSHGRVLHLVLLVSLWPHLASIPSLLLFYSISVISFSAHSQAQTSPVLQEPPVISTKLLKIINKLLSLRALLPYSHSLFITLDYCYMKHKKIMRLYQLLTAFHCPFSFI
jgi:hypothetical protein